MVRRKRAGRPPYAPCQLLLAPQPGGGDVSHLISPIRLLVQCSASTHLSHLGSLAPGERTGIHRMAISLSLEADKDQRRGTGEPPSDTGVLAAVLALF